MSLLPGAYCFEHSFTDFDQLASEACHWDLDLRQLDRGSFHGELLQFGVGKVHISEARFGRSLRQKGAPPAGLRTIALPANQNVQFVWRGERVDSDQLMVFPRGADLSSVSNPSFHVYTCSFPEQLLAAVSESIGVGDIDTLVGDLSVIRCRTSVLQAVRRCLRDLCQAARCLAPSQHDGAGVHQPGHELPQRLLSAIASSPASRTTAKIRKRESALLRAENYIEQRACEDISVRDITRAAQVSQRTLEYAFVERFGLTPKAYLTAYRLNGVRRLLRAADPTKEKVGEIAGRWGFWHMGQFAADYRKQFDELPSQTLRRESV